MKRTIPLLQNKFQPFLFLRVYLILAPILFLIYFAVNAGLKGESFAEYLTSQPINPVMLVIALLSFFWFAIVSTAQSQSSEKIWTRVLIFFIASNVLTGNLAAIILGYMTLKQDVVLKEKSDDVLPHLSLIVSVIIGFLILISLVICFALIRITVA